MEIILFQPEIPQNCGNIVRTCAVTGSKLILIRPLGFSLATRHLKRAGLDYFQEIEPRIVDSLEEVLKTPFYFFSSKAKKNYTEIPFSLDTQLIFGSETSGFPKHLWEKWEEVFYTIPMKEGARCLNLSNAVAIALYEGIRQIGFP